MKVTANQITILRVIFVPFMLFFIFFREYFKAAPLIALCIFILGAITDILDGNFARKTNTITNAGKFLDPIADKIFSNSVMIALIFADVFSASSAVIKILAMLCVIIMLVREFAILAIRLIAMEQNVVIGADSIGKTKTIVSFISFGFFLLWLYNPDVASYEVAREIFYISGTCFLYLATFLSIFSGVNYYLKNKDKIVF